MCVLELKNAFTAKEIYEIVDIIKMREYLDKVIFISFCLENLLILKEKYPEQPAMLLCGFIPDDVIEMLAEKKLGIDVHYPALFENSGFYERLRDAGLEINCWTCDGTADGERLAELGVDYITTNILE